MLYCSEIKFEKNMASLCVQFFYYSGRVASNVCPVQKVGLYCSVVNSLPNIFFLSVGNTDFGGSGEGERGRGQCRYIFLIIIFQ
jgi:hypothetical protein